MSHRRKAIVVDFSTVSTFRGCHEKSRFGYVEHLQPLEERTPLSFGTAFHAGVAAFYRSILRVPRAEAVRQAKLAFVHELRSMNTAMPISIDSDQKRSVERGVALLDAYFDVWKGETYRNATRPDTGEPYVEIGFAVYFMEWRGIPVVYVGRIDRVMVSELDGMLYNFETKTTAQSLTQFTKQTRPNHQVTGYHWAAKEMLKREFRGTIWDCIFVSDRKPDLEHEDPWMEYGVDSKKDFARTTTYRTAVDIEEFLFDLEMTTTHYLNLRAANLRRWERNAPSACFTYGACPYIEICGTNINENIVTTKFVVKEWKPWEGILEEDMVVNFKDLEAFV